tara:strand:+ start:15 stop:632 length:618 start_codon:yes stop_codon:yes gene_type:complete
MPKKSKKQTPPATPANTTEVTETSKPTEVTEVTETKQEFNYDLTERFDEILKRHTTWLSEGKELTKLFKNLHLEHKKVVKTLKKNTRGKQRRVLKDGETRGPSGFTVPAPISDELAKFLGEKKGSLVPRTEVTRAVNLYVKNKNLQNPNNRKIIIPDAKLKKLLGPLDTVNKNKKTGLTDSEVGYTYFNLQKYLKPHFIKTTPVA